MNKTETTANTEPTSEARKPRGFASLTQAQRAQIASMGGKASQALGKAHRFNVDTAREAGQKGGRARWEKVQKQKDMQTAAAVAVAGGNV